MAEWVATTRAQFAALCADRTRASRDELHKALEWLATRRDDAKRSYAAFVAGQPVFVAPTESARKKVRLNAKTVTDTAAFEETDKENRQQPAAATVARVLDRALANAAAAGLSVQTQSVAQAQQVPATPVAVKGGISDLKSAVSLLRSRILATPAPAPGPTPLRAAPPPPPSAAVLVTPAPAPQRAAPPPPAPAVTPVPVPAPSSAPASAPGATAAATPPVRVPASTPASAPALAPAPTATGTPTVLKSATAAPVPVAAPSPAALPSPVQTAPLTPVTAVVQLPATPTTVPARPRLPSPPKAVPASARLPSPPSTPSLPIPEEHDSDEDWDNPRGPRPTAPRWAQRPQLQAALQQQYEITPSRVFGQPTVPDMTAIFGHAIRAPKRR